MERNSATESKIKVKPLSRARIRKIAKDLKRDFCLTNGRIDIIKFIEGVSSILGMDYEYVEDSQLPNKYAETDPLRKIIIIKESVCIRAANGSVRDRFTLAHELGHIVLHSLNNPEVKFCRFDEVIKPYEDIEWQANTFAAEFLVDVEEAKNLTIEEIVEKYGVSQTVAAIQKKNC